MKSATIASLALVFAALVACQTVNAQDADEAPVRSQLSSGETYGIAEDVCIRDDRPAMLMEVLQGLPEFSIFTAAVQAAGLEDGTLDSAGAKKTIYAPTDEAFEDFFADFNTTSEELLGDAQVLQNIISFHMVPSVVPYKDIYTALLPMFMSQVSVATDLLGNTLSMNLVEMDDGEIMMRVAGYASAAFMDPRSIWACNGVIQGLNYVLVPKTATASVPELRTTGGN